MIRARSRALRRVESSGRYSNTTKERTVSSPTQLESFENEKIRCVVAHDHVLLRQGLRRLLEDEPDMKVVAEAGDAAEALRKVFEHRPESGLTDTHIFDCAVDQTEWLILQESPNSKVLFLTHEGHELLPDARGEV